MKCMSVKIVPQLLPTEPKVHQLSVASNLPECAETDENLFKNIVNSSLVLKISWKVNVICGNYQSQHSIATFRGLQNKV